MANLAPKDTWDPHVLQLHPMFWPLVSSAASFVNAFQNWPILQDYQNFLNNSDNPVLVRSAKRLTVVAQDNKPTQFEDSYEPRIYLKGELQTRTESWHDFFQVLVWKNFPITKAILNEQHYQAIKSRLTSTESDSRRSILENTLTQYDECGAVIISPNAELLDIIREFNWKKLFWEKRDQVTENLKCIVFGHAIYEKAVNPYVGMTCHSVLLSIPQDIFNLPTAELLPYVDKLLQQQFAKRQIQAPQDLSPFPLLGIPGWHPDNSQESFYENTDYFRPGRKQKN